MAVNGVQHRANFFEALLRKRHVMTAVILRDMRTRFFNHGLGFLVVSLWPLAHMVILLGIYTALGRRVPYGDSPYIFFASGLIPTLGFTYVSRFMCLSIILNRPMLAFPAVTVSDIMFGRAFLEVIGAFITLLFVVTILLALGEAPYPVDLEQAVQAYLATLLLAIGVGSLASVITMIAPFFATIYALFMIIIYLTSGVVFVASAMPQQVIAVISWNPVLHSVEWMRSSYFLGYPDQILDKEYLLKFAVCSLFLGLLTERLLRRNIMDA